MQILDVLLVIGGLVLLIVGGEALVRGAASIATRIGMSPLIVGLIVVSAATSAPELAVTVGSVISGEPGLAVGNVIGSNIVNILLILGLSALVMPLLIKRQLVRFDIPVMVGLSILLVAVSLDGQIGLLDGVLLLAGLVVHAVLSILIGRREVRVGAEGAGTAPIPTPGSPTPVWLSLLLLVVGIGLLVLGSQLLVTGAVSIATGLGVSSLVVGLTVVAIGTSLPELATSIIAVRRGERDMAVGNIVGSNIFNIGMVLGLPAIIFGEGIPVPAAAIALDLPVMLATAIALLPIAFTGFIIARWEGGLFVAIYIAYTAYLVLAATQHNALEGFTDVMLWFVVPLIALTLIVVTTYEAGLHRGKRLAAREASDERSQPGG
ncbi:calcium/sodium antiporter [Chryseoglobus sp. 28M-23]|uniref:calcium/sodium antiporter n=1 Tax=Chryseoglobus sp. 28M-23 TaxID=2772253 RepID=UPI001746D615|nr:calcium/sodium antiporter [Chryseoglobus sp. 28M-23]QOD94255.1 calcium/sodium antiporter [Chryseoglobus sp. 28M-23]